MFGRTPLLVAACIVANSVSCAGSLLKNGEFVTALRILVKGKGVFSTLMSMIVSRIFSTTSPRSAKLYVKILGVLWRAAYRPPSIAQGVSP